MDIDNRSTLWPATELDNWEKIHGDGFFSFSMNTMAMSEEMYEKAVMLGTISIAFSLKSTDEELGESK